MEAPNAEALNSKTFNLPDSDIELVLYRSNILISYIDSNNDYSKRKKFSHNFPFEKLLYDNNFFQMYNSIEDIYKFLLDKIDRKHFKIDKTKNKLDFIIKIDTYGIDNPKFTLYENELENNETKEKLINSIKALEKENSEIKDKLKILENNYNLINSEFQLFKKQISQLINSKLITSFNEDNLFEGSTILSFDEKKQISNWFNNKRCSFNMIYKAKRDGDSADNFHKKCDGKKNNIIIIQTSNGIKFGGYTSKSWEGDGYKEDKEAFVFSINKNKKYSIKNNYNFYKNAIYCNPTHGPRFGGGREIYILDNCCNTNLNECNSPDSYDTIYNSELTLGMQKFQVYDYEVYQIS